MAFCLLWMENWTVRHPFIHGRGYEAYIAFSGAIFGAVVWLLSYSTACLRLAAARWLRRGLQKALTVGCHPCQPLPRCGILSP